MAVKIAVSPKVVAVLTAAVLTVGLIALAVVLLNVSHNDPDFAYEYSEEFDGITVTRYKGSDIEVVVPDKIMGRDVMEIGETAFYNCESIAVVTIPDGVIEIGYGSFSGCTDLAEITIPDSVTTIEACAFKNCTALTMIFLPDSVTTIDGGAFDGCDNITITYKGEQYTAEEFEEAYPFQ